MSLQTKDPFWMVWSPRGHRPIVRHASLAIATTEAERLGAKHPGRHFYVLEMVGFAMTGAPTETTAQAARAAAELSSN